MSSSPPTSTGIARFIPGVALIKGFSPALLSTEFVVAITVFAVLVPSAMAYGDLAGVTPVAGLYVALGAMVMYALFGSSKQVITGPEATAAIMTATAVAPLAGGDAARYAALAALLAILVGVVALLARVAKLGFITDLLSKPVLVGYIFGATLIVIGSQLGKMFGIKIESDMFFQQVVELIRRLDETHLLTFAIGVVCMAVLLIIRRVNRKLPGPLVVVVGAIVLSYVLGWEAKGVAVVGPVPAGLPKVTIPAVTAPDVLALLPAALALLVLIYADEILTSRVFAAKHAQKIDANQEFVGLGTANIAAGFLTGFPAAIERVAHDRQRSDGRQNAVGWAHRGRAHHHLPALFHPAAGAAAHRRAGRHHYRRLARFDRHRGVPLPAAGAARRVLAGGHHGVRRALRRRPGRNSRRCGAFADYASLSHGAAARCAAGRRRRGRRHGLSRRRRQGDGD